MESFKLFFEKSEEEKNVQQLIKKLPAIHQKLLSGYKFRYQGGNTLKGDDGHIGVIFKDKITVAAPWRYSREFCTLHEVAHLVYEKLMTPELKKAWSKVAKKNKKQNQDHDEENFCMAYAATYSEHPPLTHHHPDWIDFIKNKVPK